jgi:hypothetical protein
MSRSMSKCALFALLPLALLTWPAGAALAVRVSGNQVSITGARPLARLMVVAYGHHAVGGADTEFDYSAESTADPTGAASITPPVLPFQSIWVVTDPSGDFAVAVPPGYRHRVANAPAAAIAVDGSISNDMPGSVMWVVRPGVGRWRSVLAHGTAADESPRGTPIVKRGLPSFQAPDPKLPPLTALLPGDVIVAFGFDMRYWTLRIAPPR